MVIVDARGLSCPEPVVMTRKAMMDKQAKYQVLVDNLASKENVTRYAQHQGYAVQVEETGGEYTLTLTKAGATLQPFIPISEPSASKSCASKKASR